MPQKRFNFKLYKKAFNEPLSTFQAQRQARGTPPVNDQRQSTEEEWTSDSSDDE